MSDKCEYCGGVISQEHRCEYPKLMARINNLVDEAYRDVQRRLRLKADVKRLREALERIAKQVFVGDEPYCVTIAKQALGEQD